MNINIKVHKPFGNLYRRATVLVVVKDMGGMFIFGNKPEYYPKGITRLLGGGVKDGEAPCDAAVREMSEEVGTDLKREQFVDLGNVVTKAEADDGSKYEMVTYLFFVRLDEKGLKAGDDVASLRLMSMQDVDLLINNYMALPDGLWRKEAGEDFSWGDYGKVYGQIHKIAFDEVKKKGL